MSKTLKIHHHIVFTSPKDGHDYAFDIYLTEEQRGIIQGAKIVEVNEIINLIPGWAVDLGLTGLWCFVQDVFHFRNPFRSWRTGG